MSLHHELSERYPLSPSQIDAFEHQGFIKLKNVLSPAVLAHYGREITRLVLKLNKQDKPLKERDTYHQAFLQVANLWQHSAIVREFVFSTRLARIATDLLRTSGVRLYHDQALYKEPGGGYTPWHADQQYWPLATGKCVTAWIPLQETPVAMGALAFSSGSHRFEYGRDLPISEESERLLAAALDKAGFPYVETGYALGEVSFHYGWTFHRAGGNATRHNRSVMTVIYMDEHMCLAEPANENQKIDADVWCPGVKPGEVIASELNPVLFSSENEG